MRILDNKFRIVQGPLNVSPDFAMDIVKAWVLHNFVPEIGGCQFEDSMTVTGLEDVPDG